MVNPTPKAPYLRSGVYEDEPATFGDINAIQRWLIENHIRYSLSSPPLLKDVKEGTCVIDATLFRLYFNIGGALKYIQMT